MKKRIVKIKDLLVVSNKGNGLLITLNLLNVLMLLLFSFQIQLKGIQISQQKHYEIERLKVLALRRIKKEFYKMECEDFELEEGSSKVSVTYDEFNCQLVFRGEDSFTIHLTYDDIFGCIGSVYYE